MQYELVVICAETASDDVLAAVTSKVRERVEGAGGTMEVESWGKRLMAYDVKDFRSGIYTLYKLDVPTSVPATIEAALRVDESVLRFMTVLKSDPVVVDGAALRDLESDESISVSYKTPDLLLRFVSERGKINARRLTRLDAEGQRAIAREIKRARMLALIPFTTTGQ